MASQQIDKENQSVIANDMNKMSLRSKSTIESKTNDADGTFSIPLCNFYE